MKYRVAIALLIVPALAAGCSARRELTPQSTLADLRKIEPDTEEVEVEHGLEQAMQHYRKFLEETPETAMTPEAMRRLADLQLEKQFGVVGAPEMAAPERAASPVSTPADPSTTVVTDAWEESLSDFEQRTTESSGVLRSDASFDLPGDPAQDTAGPLEAIALYDKLLAEYPNYEHRDKVLYQKARAYDELGRTDEAIETMEALIRANPHSEHFDEVQFRRGEYFFTRRSYIDAENAYQSVIGMGTGSRYFELALYKLGWTYYKQEFYEEALHRYMALLDHKVSIGYDFDQSHAEDDERRVSDTFRVVSLSFNNLGGPEAVSEYYGEFGHRGYEDRVYRNLGEHYLENLRYDDASRTFRTFIALYPFHRNAPQFSMRVVDTFTAGEFPLLVLEAKREFASLYGLQADYWHHFAPEDRPEVLAYLKADLRDLATHYHAEYQAFAEIKDEEDVDAELLASYDEALRWYGDYLQSFPEDEETPSINYRLADLHLEHGQFGQAARQYERTAYDYETHEQSAAAGYAAVYAYREQLKATDEMQQDAVTRDTIASSLRFADTFPDHDQAAVVLGAAADDQYEMQDYAEAVHSASRVIAAYPDAEGSIRRSAWIVVAHGSFELGAYPEAEGAYTQVLAATPEDDESHAGFVDNLAATIYRQGEAANEAEDYRGAADHFLRIRTAAPSSTIRATAEYDAGAALIRLAAWAEAASVLEAFRDTFPDHELHLEATRQIAYAYRENGDLSQAAGEYVRIADESGDTAMQSEALLVAGDLYEQSEDRRQALQVYLRYVDEFPQPVETNLETRFKIAGMYRDNHDTARYHDELATIVRLDADAGAERTGRTRTLAGRSALVLAEVVFDDFTEIQLTQPFEVSLQEKQARMEHVTEAMGRLVDYEIADVTAAATFYMAETYFEFSRSLNESERPGDLGPAELAEYELVLEEEAYPYEERAIEVHEKNLELLQTGVFNPWTEKSLGKLAERVPGRYAKNEISVDLLGSVDRYVYLYPGCRVEGPMTGTARNEPVEAPAETTRLVSPEPIVEDTEVDDANPQ